MATGPKDILPIPQGLEPALRNPLVQMREALQVLLGFTGDPNYRAITRVTLGELGAIPGGGGTIPGGGGTVDDTPPPDVTGLTVNAGLSHIIVSWDVPLYTQGHGNLKTNVYAVQKASTDASLPTFGDATLVMEASGPLTIVAIPSNLGVRWHVWAKYETVDGVESNGTGAGVNGVVGQTGMIDGTDLAPLLIEARHLRTATPSVFPDQTFEGGANVWPTGSGHFIQRVADASAPLGFYAEFSGRDNVSRGLPITVWPGDQYAVSLSVNRDAELSAIDAGLVIYAVALDGSVIFTWTASAPLASTGYQRVTVNATAPAGAAQLVIGPWINQAHGGPLKGRFSNLIAERRITANLVTTNMIEAGSGAIGALAIDHAMIGNEVVDNSNIANLSAAKLTIGDGTVGGNLKSTNFNGINAGWIVQPNGYAEFNNVVVRGATYTGSITSGSGSIGGITISLNDLRSTNYVPATAGFRLNNDGSAEFYNVTARGNITANALNAATGTFSGSLSGATGTFAGSLSAATGTFSGDLSAASGTFTGVLSGASGSFSGTLTAQTITAANIVNAELSDLYYAAAGGTSVSVTVSIPFGARAFAAQAHFGSATYVTYTAGGSKDPGTSVQYNGPVSGTLNCSSFGSNNSYASAALGAVNPSGGTYTFTASRAATSGTYHGNVSIIVLVTKR